MSDDGSYGPPGKAKRKSAFKRDGTIDYDRLVAPTDKSKALLARSMAGEGGYADECHDLALPTDQESEEWRERIHNIQGSVCRSLVQQAPTMLACFGAVAGAFWSSCCRGSEQHKLVHLLAPSRASLWTSGVDWNVTYH